MHRQGFCAAKLLAALCGLLCMVASVHLHGGAVLAADDACRLSVTTNAGVVSIHGCGTAADILGAFSRATGVNARQESADCSWTRVDVDGLPPVEALLKAFPDKVLLVRLDSASGEPRDIVVSAPLLGLGVFAPLAISADELNVLVPDGMEGALQGYLQCAGGEVAGRIPALSMALVRLPAGADLAGAAAALKAAGFSTVRPNILGRRHGAGGSATPVGAPNDEFYTRQSALAGISAQAAWDLYAGLPNPAGVVCAVVDSGVEWDHPDLAADMWANVREGGAPNGLDDDGNGYIDDIHGFNFTNAASTTLGYSAASPLPTDSHGTCVAGIIAAVPNDSIGIAGMARNTVIMNVKLLDHEGSQLTSSFAISQSIVYAAQNGARVINCSFGFDAPDAFVEQACRKAVSLGAVLVCSAGNTGASQIQYPAGFDIPGVISVGVVDEADQPAAVSAYGQWVDIFAPGSTVTTILPTYNSDNVLCYYGIVGAYTSYAAALVSGEVSLILSANPQLSPAQVEAIIKAGVDVLPQLAGRCATSGRANALKALQQAVAVTTDAAAPASDGALGSSSDVSVTPAAASSASASAAGGGGCGLDPRAAPGLEWLLLAAAPLLRRATARRV